MFAIYVVAPVDILNVEPRFGYAANKALSLDLVLVLLGDGALVRERINNNTEQNVHQHNIDDDEEAEVKHSPIVELVLRITAHRLVHRLAYATAGPHANIHRGEHAIVEVIAV